MWNTLNDCWFDFVSAVLGLLSSCELVRRRLAFPRGCVDSTRFRRLVLDAAEVLAGSAIDVGFTAPPLTVDTHSLLSSVCRLYTFVWNA